MSSEPIIPESSLQASREAFSKNGFTVVPKCLSGESIALLHHYLDFQQRHNPVYFYKDNFAKGRYADFLCESILLYLQPTMEAICGRKLYPTFSYLRVYSKGDTLSKHLDRQIAEFSGTMTFDFKSDHIWPIWIESNKKSYKCDLNKGDILIYKGKELPHWREKFEGESWIQCFFHFVDANGPYQEWKHDKRSGGIGSFPENTEMNIQDKIQLLKGILK